MPAVNTSKARSGVAFTLMLLRTGATVMVLIMLTSHAEAGCPFPLRR